MSKLLLVLSLLTFLSLAQPAAAQEPTAELYTHILYDRNGDGLYEGVGRGVTVTVQKPDGTGKLTGKTNSLSSVGFYVTHGTWLVDAYPPPTRLFFVWVCELEVLVDEPTEHRIIDCVERFFIRFPWAQS